MTKKLIPPTVGRVVLYFQNAEATKPWPGLVTDVHSDRLINVAGFNSFGTWYAQNSCPLLQEEDLKPEAGPYCTWMPYQLGQAAKTEEAEAIATARAAREQGGGGY